MLKPRTVLWCTAVVFAVSVAVTVQGLLNLDPQSAIKWTPGGAARALGLVTALAVLLQLASLHPRLGPGRGAALLLVALATLGGAVPALLGVAALGVASALVGRRLRALWGDRVDLAQDLVTSLLVGAGVYGTLAAFLAHGPINYAGLYLFLVLVPIAIEWREVLALGGRTWTNALALAGGQERPVAIGAACLAGVYVVIALLPELGWDALALHLLIPRVTLDELQWHHDVRRHTFAVAPALGNWLIAFAYAAGGETGARMLLTGAVGVLALLTGTMARRAGAQSPWDWIAAVLVLTTPLTFTIGSSLFIDALWAAFLVAGVAIVLFPRDTRQPGRELVTAAALIGFAAATKAVTLPLLPIVAAVALARHGSHRGAPWLLAVGVAVAAGAKPYATAWLLTGNPVFPFFNDVFRSPLLPDGAAIVVERFARGLHWDDLYAITFRSAQHIEGRAGAAGFQWMLLLPAAAVAALLGRMRAALWLAATGAALFAAPFHFQNYLRYVVPAFALGSAAIAVAASALSRSSRPAAWITSLAAGACCVLNVVFLNAAATYESMPLAAAFGDARARHALVTEAMPQRLAAVAATELSQRSGRVGFFAVPTFADARIDSVHWRWYTPAFARELSAAASAAEVAQVLARWEVRYVVYDPNWSPPPRRGLVEQATLPVGAVGTVEIRKVRPDLALTRELLANAEFTAAGRWEFPAGQKRGPEGRGVVVSADAPAYQPVAVEGGAVYLLSVEARCDQHATEGRLQVIWLADDRRPGRADVRTFVCTPESRSHSREVLAPRDARVAVVYASGHTSEEIVVTGVSLRAAPSRASPVPGSAWGTP